MADVLIYGDTIRSAEMRHEIPLVVPDPFLYAELGGARHVVVSSIESARIAALNSGLEVHSLEEFGWDELVAGGVDRHEAEQAVNVRACLELAARHARVPSEFPLELADRLRTDGITLATDRSLFTARRRVKNASELAGIRRAQRAAVGEAPDELRRYHELTLESLRRSMAALGPGAAGLDVYGVSCEPYEQAGLPTQRTKQPGQVLDEGFYHSLGHGVGLEVHEAPLLGRAPDRVVAGDVVTLEPGCYRPGFGGCRLEDLVLVTDDGAELLTDFPYDLEP